MLSSTERDRQTHRRAEQTPSYAKAKYNNVANTSATYQRMKQNFMKAMLFLVR